ncbi:MAG: carboxypeptidase regulatory-like domain-containing protein [Flavobacteriales bacterium]
MKRILLITIGIFIASLNLHAQMTQGAIKATVTDESGEPLPFANVIVKQNGVQVTGGQTDFDGLAVIKPLGPGKYDVEISSLGFATKRIEGVQVGTATTNIPKDQTVMSTNATVLDAVEVVYYKKPLFEKGGGNTETITSDEVSRMAARSPADLAATAGGTYSSDNGSSDINIRGSRSDANYYFIDGIKVRGSSSIPRSSIDQISVLSGGLPAQYGDVTGGVVTITTKGVSNEYHGGIEYLTSGVKMGENSYVGLDPYGYNLLEMSLSGPFFSKTDSLGIKKPLLGFFLSGNFTSNLDPRPSTVGAWKIKDDVLADIEADPLRVGFTPGSVIPNTDYLRLNDFERVKVRPNTNNVGANLAGKIDVQTTSSTNLTFGGSLNYSKGKDYDFSQSLFNYGNYPEQTSLDWRTYGRFTQRFNNGQSDESSASLIKNAYYTVQLDFSQQLDKRQNATHKDDLFNYGYIGKFQTYQTANYIGGTDSTTGIFGLIQSTYEDTLISFQPGTANPELAEFTQKYYELNGWEGFDAEGNPIFDPNQREAFVNYNNIQSGGGLLNGDNLDERSRTVYGMWAFPNDVSNSGSAIDNYRESVTNQLRVTAMGSADIKHHAFMLGFEYEQRIDRAYSISPRSLWRIARQRANSHISELDISQPNIEYPGPIVTYPRLNSSPGPYDATDGNESQSFIDYNLRKATGLDPDGVDFLDVNAIDPSVYKLEYFSADELYNQGQSLVSYYGYDPYGNKTKDVPTFDEFFTARDEYGNYTRPIAPYQPIYVAGYIQDQFEFEDLVFNVGLRVDRFDANQRVLKDKYVLFPTIKAGELAENGYFLEEGQSVPGNIGDDYVVYVDNVQNPSAILGYRDGDTWYNAEGAELNDASSLRTSSGLPAPLLIDKENTASVDITSESFEDYKPQTNFMPRISFNFPISDVAKFFAHYDILTKRPTVGNRLDPSDYYYLESLPSSAVLNNPALQPEKTIDYEIGFKQALTTSMALTISAFYRESRNMVASTRVFDAYPIEYVTYANLDFSTVKGLTFSYDLRQTKNLTIRASYTLQFAEGTGSNATSGLNLARSGQGNLRAPIRMNYDQRHQIVANFDYRYGEGSSYNGPVIGERQILKNTGANLQLRGGSGVPYNPQANITSTVLYSNTPAALQSGKINSASLPWSFRFDLVVDRDFKLSKENGKRNYDMNVYLQVLNLLNARNINGVYRATGNPDDDGYLNSSIGIQSVEQQNSPLAYQEYYTMKLWNPNQWQLPRRIRLGVRLSF